MSHDQQTKPNATQQRIQSVCTFVGIVAAMGVMVGTGFSGAIPGAVFGAAGGVVGWLIGYVIGLAVVKE